LHKNENLSDIADVGEIPVKTSETVNFGGGIIQS
jgi:hypothetical protein